MGRFTQRQKDEQLLHEAWERENPDEAIRLANARIKKENVEDFEWEVENRKSASLSKFGWGLFFLIFVYWMYIRVMVTT